eukprot:10617848-Alexandrium_andersonii.AAC.1
MSTALSGLGLASGSPQAARPLDSSDIEHLLHRLATRLLSPAVQELSCASAADNAVGPWAPCRAVPSLSLIHI